MHFMCIYIHRSICLENVKPYEEAMLSCVMQFTTYNVTIELH